MFEVIDRPVYAGFWRRAGSNLLDGLVLLPLSALQAWLATSFRLYPVYAFVPNVLFAVFFHVYLVKRFGGTPGKRLMSLRITALEGTPVTWRQAWLRNGPQLVLGVCASIVGLVALFQMSDAEFHSLSFVPRSARLQALAPHYWLHAVNTLQTIWVVSELIVLLTNDKRRAVHDFIAGTVVIREPDLW